MSVIGLASALVSTAAPKLWIGLEIVEITRVLLGTKDPRPQVGGHLGQPWERRISPGETPPAAERREDDTAERREDDAAKQREDDTAERREDDAAKQREGIGHRATEWKSPRRAGIHECALGGRSANDSAAAKGRGF
jgi:hypothetical protein